LADIRQATASEGDLKGSDILIVIAEVAAAFAGFAGVVSIFRHRGSGAWEPPDAYRFRFMVELSLCTVAFALLPFIVHHFGVPPRVLWSSCSALLGFMYVALLVLARIRARHLRGGPGVEIHRGLMTFAVGGAIVGLVLLALNALQVGFVGEFGPYLAGLAWLLTISGIMFLRLLLLGIRGPDSSEP
jgi:hypothetical protein